MKKIKLIVILYYSIAMIVISSCNFNTIESDIIEVIGLKYIMQNAINNKESSEEDINFKRLRDDLKGYDLYANGVICGETKIVTNRNDTVFHLKGEGIYYSLWGNHKFNIPEMIQLKTIDEFKDLKNMKSKFLVARKPVLYKEKVFQRYDFYNKEFDESNFVILEFDEYQNPKLYHYGWQLLIDEEEFKICH